MNRIHYFLLFFPLCAAAFSVVAQEERRNLVPNPGFEQYKNEPDRHGFMDDVKGWKNANRTSPPIYPQGTPDYLYEVDSVDYLYERYVLPRSGKGVAGLITYMSRLRNFREYMSCKLKEPLVPGAYYVLAMYVSTGMDESFGSVIADGFGASLTMHAPRQAKHEPIRLQPQCYHDHVVYSRRWKRLEFKFQADSAYRFLTLGNFKDDYGTRRIVLREDIEPQAYVFIDDLSLVMAEGPEEPEPPKKDEPEEPELSEAEREAAALTLADLQDVKRAPVAVEGRQVVRQGFTAVGDSALTVKVWDPKFVDGDVISLQLNGEWVLREYELRGGKESIDITLDPKANNYLILYAHNLGADPPNTAALVVKSGWKTVVKVNLSSDLGKCGAYELRYRPEE